MTAVVTKLAPSSNSRGNSNASWVGTWTIKSPSGVTSWMDDDAAEVAGLNHIPIH
ncbi:MAG: hypothetical protein R3C11_11485 [Planctomycetaceae bacterium]